MPLNVKSVYPASDPEFISFPSRRSVVHSTDGIVSCSQPLAAKCGLRILHEGGNAADAAVAVAAGLNMSEPCMTGIGGDMFCLFYDAKTKKVRSLNGSGRAGSKCTLEKIRSSLGLTNEKHAKIPMSSVHSVTVPGAAAGWVDVVENFGSGMSLEQVLTPAIEMGEKGFPLHEITSLQWRQAEKSLKAASPNFAEMLKPDPNAPDGCRGPRAGEIFKNPTLAQTFRSLAKDGKKGFYTGRIAEALIKVCKDLGGHLELEDLENHMNIGSEITEPISLKFTGQGVKESHKSYADGQSGQGDEEEHGVEVWEHPPNGQGIIALMALGILEELERTGKIPTFAKEQHNSAAHIHAVVEALRIAFADGNWWIADPNVVKVPIKELISKPYLAERAKLFDPTKASPALDHGEPSPAHNHSDTVYFAVTDKWGNGISFINSNYGGFGTGIIPKGCGFTLQNRGANFRLDEGHPNVYAPGKRPYHTIIPAMITNAHDGSLHSVYGVMGGFMQPQGHVQVLLNMLAFKYNPQAALDAPRICIGAGMPDQGNVMDRTVYLEEGIGEQVKRELEGMGHKCEIVKGFQRGLFGRGQVIRAHVEDGQLVYSAGCDPRTDGAAYPA